MVYPLKEPYSPLLTGLACLSLTISQVSHKLLLLGQLINSRSPGTLAIAVQTLSFKQLHLYLPTTTSHSTGMATQGMCHTQLNPSLWRYLYFSIISLLPDIQF
jgi:hypothetical protein